MSVKESMLNPDKLTFGSFEDISKRCSDDILEYAKSLGKSRKKIIMALCGGRSVRGIFQNFSMSEDPIWKNIHIFLIDERVADISSNESNFKLIKDSFADELIRKGVIPEKNLHPFIVNDKINDYGAHGYFEEIKKISGKNFIIDIVLLSSGEDGHIAALYPKHKLLDSIDEDYHYLDDSPKLPLKRITASPIIIENAGLTALIFAGEEKKSAYENLINVNIKSELCPAKISLESANYRIYTDIKF